MCDPFGWHKVDVTLLLEIHSKLKCFETMTFSDILGRNHHTVPIERLCKEAQNRLTVLGLDDVEELLSLRLTGISRVWGIMEHNIVVLLWWDPEHLVCPSLLKHT